nr:immunoglobulin light chain junction region [Macaca mulatta]MOX33386.1 immunoglobulin light chain junction region [Macaca mulatta]MOX33431.1 immunoglobulin light chain junction region [Macaca mulatta]MOX33773.1 immunoglobulin light chain junction region [Macaca mulatta]MOX34555.1 immunoglobulin light chain junction region [Macaca mulatta]
DYHCLSYDTSLSAYVF